MAPVGAPGSPLALMVADSPTSVSGIVMTTSSADWPGQATTVSPLAALATASLIVEKFAVAHEVPAALGVALGDAYNVGSTADDAAEAWASPAPPTATAATPTNNSRLVRNPVESIGPTFSPRVNYSYTRIAPSARVCHRRPG